MTTGEPDWSLLPERPREFFGLGAQFERQELRRTYSRLIRTYKPETHPGEFQRIRAAYEQLDAQVRYGNVQRSASITSALSIWEAVEESAGAAAKSTSSKPRTATARPASPTLVSRLESEPPTALYQELAQSSTKNPRDFYTLAVFADVLLPEDPLAFLKWILAGLKEHAHDPALFRLLQEYLRSDMPTPVLPKALQIASKVVSDDRFYLLTESVWERLLRETGFDLFRRTLAACEANLHDYRIASKMAFYTRLLRGALWKADEAWLAEAFASIEASAGEMDRALENDWELTLQLRQYRQQAARFINGNPVRARMDQVIRSFCLEPSLDSARRMVECQNSIAHDAYGVMEAFPMSAEEDSSEFLMLWLMITAWIAEDFGLEPPLVEEDVLRRQTLAALKDLREEVMVHAAKWGRFETFSSWSWLAALIGGPLVLIFTIFRLTGGMTALLVAFWLPTAALMYRLLLRPKLFEPWYDRWITRRILALYISAWRPRMFRHQHAMAVPASIVISQLVDVAQEFGDDRWLGALLQPLSADPGFRIFAAAQPFVR